MAIIIISIPLMFIYHYLFNKNIVRTSAKNMHLENLMQNYKDNLLVDYSPFKSFLPLKIVLDVGHGGIDVGAVGVSGTKESDINLEFAFCLKDILERYGVEVVLTRKDENGLYSEFKNGFKLEDMKKRKEIIEKEQPDLLISLHQNKFPASSSFGPQVFYAPQSEDSKRFAECVQNSFDNNLQTKKRPIKEGDFYMLYCTPNPSILIECGFLSNPNEEKLLLSKEYREKFCYYIVCGIFSFLV